MMKKIKFYYDENAEGDHLEYAGTLWQDGKFEGEESLERSVRKFIEIAKLDLNKDEHWDIIKHRYDSSLMVVIEEKDG